MLATRQVVGSLARSRLAVAGLGLRRMATVSDSPLDRKVSSRTLLRAACARSGC
jgi:hypothetical protein